MKYVVMRVAKFIMNILLKSFHLVPNFPFKSVALPLFDPKIAIFGKLFLNFVLFCSIFSP